MHPSNRSARPNIGFFSLLALSDFFLPSSIFYLPSTLFPPLHFDSLGNQGQKQPIPNRFTGSIENQRIIGIGRVDESGGKWDVADPGVELEIVCLAIDLMLSLLKSFYNDLEEVK